MPILTHLSQFIQAPTRDNIVDLRGKGGLGEAPVIQPTNISTNSSITSIIVNLVNFVIFALSALSLILGAISLILAIILTIQKSKNANIFWIIFGVCGAIILLSIVIFTFVSLFINTATTANLSSGI